MKHSLYLHFFVFDCFSLNLCFCCNVSTPALDFIPSLSHPCMAPSLVALAPLPQSRALLRTRATSQAPVTRPPVRAFAISIDWDSLARLLLSDSLPWPERNCDRSGPPMVLPFHCHLCCCFRCFFPLDRQAPAATRRRPMARSAMTATPAQRRTPARRGRAWEATQVGQLSGLASVSDCHVFCHGAIFSWPFLRV